MIIPINSTVKAIDTIVITEVNPVNVNPPCLGILDLPDGMDASDDKYRIIKGRWEV